MNGCVKFLNANTCRFGGLFLGLSIFKNKTNRSVNVIKGMPPKL